MQRLFVVDRDLFPRLDMAQRKEQDVAVQGSHVCVWLAGMIDVVSAITASCAIQTEAAIDVADAQDSAFARALLGFEVRDSLAGVLGNLLCALERNCGEAAFAVDVRFADCEAVSEFHPPALYDETSPQRSQRKTTAKSEGPSAPSENAVQLNGIGFVALLVSLCPCLFVFFFSVSFVVQIPA